MEIVLKISITGKMEEVYRRFAMKHAPEHPAPNFLKTWVETDMEEGTKSDLSAFYDRILNSDEEFNTLDMKVEATLLEKTCAMTGNNQSA